MLKSLLKKFRRDSADTVLITSVICAPIIAMMFGIAADTSKNVYTSNYYNTVAQASVETAVKTIDPKGNLSHTKAIPALVREFENQVKGTSADPAKHTVEGNGYVGKCTTAEIDGVERKLPYYEITLSSGRGQNNQATTKTWKFETGDDMFFTLPGYVGGTFRVIDADIYTSTGNIALSMFGQPCQVFKSQVSAIAFGDNADLEERVKPFNMPEPQPSPSPSKTAGPSILPPGYTPQPVNPNSPNPVPGNGILTPTSVPKDDLHWPSGRG